MTPSLEEAIRRLRLARRDSDTFEILLPIPRANLAALGFHAQQSVEKALKAVAALRGIEVRRTHDLVALGQLIVELGEVLPLDADDLRLLNPFAVEFRYDDDLVPMMTRAELQVLVMTILSWATQLIEQSVDSSSTST
jgi:hypothetical protein